MMQFAEGQLDSLSPLPCAFHFFSTARSSGRLRPSIGTLLKILLPLLVCGAIVLPHGAVAQEFRGTISGNVTDPSGAAVPGASVKVVETQTGTVNQTVSNSVGQYVVPFLLPGSYSITATASGFQTLTRNSITLLSQGHPIINLVLKVGSASQSVTVTGQAPLLDLANASVGDVLETKSVQNMPVNGRTPEMLAELAAGVSLSFAPHLVRPYDADAPWVMGGAVSEKVNGNGGASPETLLDGSPDEDFDFGTAYSPPMDTAREVTVQPFATDASFGHTISGVVNMITKGGANAFHASAYEFAAVSPLYANSFFNDRNVPVTPTPANHYDQYGLSASGPILIPKVFNGRNKLFFLFAWEGSKQTQPQNSILTVPTAAEREGDFSALLAGGPSYQIYEPNTGTLSNGKYSRTPVPNNCLTALSSYCSSVGNAGIAIDPVALGIEKLYPLPNYTSGVSPVTNLDNYISNAPDTLSFNSFFGRMDYNASSRDHVFFDMRRNYGYFTENDYFNNHADGYANPRWNWGATLDNVYTLNPTTVFDVRLNWMTHVNNEYGISHGVLSPTTVGFPSYMTSSSDYTLLPLMDFSTYQELGINSSTKLSSFTNYQVFASMMKIVGRHTLQIGFDGRQYAEVQTNPQDAAGAFNENFAFVNGGTGVGNQPCCADFAELEYGLANSGDYELEPVGDFRTYYIAAFVQDNWRVNDHLTLNLGVRYDLGTPWGEKFGRTVSGWNPSAVNSASAAAAAAFTPTTETVNGTTVNVSSINTAGGLTFPSSRWGAPYQIQNKAGYWSPRIGFSYNPGGFKNTVLRGGFGVFVAPQTISTSDDAGDLNAEGFSSSTAYAATNNSNFTYIDKLDNPFPSGFLKPVGSSLGASTFLGSPSNISFLAPEEHDEYSVRWTLGVQHALTTNTMLELIYEGNHGVHLPVDNNINSPELQYLTTNPYRDQNLATAYSTAVPNPFAGLLPSGSSSYNGSTTSLGNLLVPYPAYGSASITEEDMTIGQSFYETGMAHVEHRSSHGLMLMGNFQYAKTIEQDSYLNPEDTRLYRGVSPSGDFRYRLAAGGTYELPFGRGKVFGLGGSRLANQIAGGWVLNGIYQFQTGLPIDFTSDIPLQPGMTIHDIKSRPRDTSTTTPALSTNVFVTGSGTCKVAAGQACDGTEFFNGQYADHYRTLPYTMSWVRQDGYNNLDASMLKNFPINTDGSAYLQFRFETFNTLNRQSFAGPNLTPTKSNFGTITKLASKSISRGVQIGGRLVF